MIKQRTLTSATLLAAALALSACGDQPQELNASGTKQDKAPYQGVGASQYVQDGWKVGDRTSWEQQLKARAQYGQNDYSRVSGQ
jgi:hypothetical protein